MQKPTWRHNVKTLLPTLLLSAIITGSAFTQALAPELAPFAAKYKTDLAALETQRTAAIAQAQAPYMAALASAEKTATASGNVAAASAVAAERARLTSGLSAPGFPPDLPKQLQQPRKAYFDAVERIRAADAPRQQAVSSAYLRALGTLSAKAPRESELAKQLEAEKQKLLASAPGTGENKVSRKNVVVNGTFDLVDERSQPKGWIIDEGFKVTRDGTNNVLHASQKAPAYQQMTQDILLPPKARSVTLSGRVRGKILARDTAKSQGPPGLFVSAVYLDKNDAATKNWLMLDGGSDDQWKNVTMTERIPEGMKTLQVTLAMKWVSGEFDFDNIEVEFR
jgi:hypothetical protein